MSVLGLGFAFAARGGGTQVGGVILLAFMRAGLVLYVSGWSHGLNLALVTTLQGRVLPVESWSGVKNPFRGSLPGLSLVPHSNGSSLAPGSPKLQVSLRGGDDGSVQPVAILLNISVVSGHSKSQVPDPPPLIPPISTRPSKHIDGLFSDSTTQRTFEITPSARSIPRTLHDHVQENLRIQPAAGNNQFGDPLVNMLGENVAMQGYPQDPHYIDVVHDDSDMPVQVGYHNQDFAVPYVYRDAGVAQDIPVQPQAIQFQVAPDTTTFRLTMLLSFQFQGLPELLLDPWLMMPLSVTVRRRIISDALLATT
ncbi:hypothetical protein BGW80DRAFT_1465456 [Lactifluus volemus]|nr:hypothetical protein BGW80DRAFT_1465456 [Lactifluus volemus]